ncbi:hypothetical protein KMP13_03230 [Epibacterium ulvae]|uniref:hypothetical protein n=1 Tax=Epibacterium ulvae TaxID=1156985 RepID=UPI001BFCD2E4|nr:hypothetical protein [Epibacterium ulvae]MBT8152915.1 hypothetical protein [Epibacterium ulvae]
MTTIDISTAAIEVEAQRLEYINFDKACPQATLLRALAQDRDMALVEAHQAKCREHVLKDNTGECRRLRRGLNAAGLRIKQLDEKLADALVEAAMAHRCSFATAGQAIREALGTLPKSLEIETEQSVLTLEEIEQVITEVCGADIWNLWLSSCGLNSCCAVLMSMGNGWTRKAQKVGSAEVVGFGPPD